MDATAIDHVNLRTPEDGLADIRAFYVDALGFSLVDTGGSLVTVRLSPDAIIHFRPTEDFEPPTLESFDHVAIRVDHDIGTLKERLEAAGVEVERENESPVGATGTAPAVYVRDPFGYRVELKATA